MNILPKPKPVAENKLINFKTAKRNLQKYKVYNFLFFTMTLLPIALAGSLNYLSDPYDLFDTPDWFGINHAKPQKDNNDRLFKAADIIRQKPDTIILGSSRAKQGLDPSHPSLKDKSTYNLALNGANFYELKRYLEHAVKNNPNLKEVIIGIDFFMFNENLKNQPTFSEDRLEKTYIDSSDLINSLFSLTTLEASEKNLQASLKEKDEDPNYGKNGYFPHRNTKDGKTLWRFEYSINLYLASHHDFKLSQQYLSDFREVVEFCKQHNIDLKVFISPAHATEWEVLKSLDDWETFENWKREIVKITPVWDFSGYNSITSEKIAPVMDNYADNSHYTHQVGNLILDRIFNYQVQQVPADFGILMTPENIEQHLEKIRRDRETWAQQHPDEIKLVQRLKTSYFDTHKKVQ